MVLGLAMLLAVNWWVSAAYHFADGYPLASVTGKNDLWKLGTTSVRFTATGLLLVAVTAIGIVMFEPPPPDVGG